jgi:L-malate glycosyltransferase
MKKILFITPYFQRSGSELVLYNIISGLDRSQYEIALCVTRGKGELLDILPGDIKTFLYTEYYDNKLKLIESINKKFLYRIFRFIVKLFSPSKIFPEEVKADYTDFFNKVNSLFKADAWYINTVLIPEAITYSEKFKIPCIVHSHEMENIYSLLNEKDLNNLINIPELIIACSESSANPLRISGRKNNIEVCYPFPDLNKINPPENSSGIIRTKYNIPDTSFIWTMSGMPDINKNPLIFVEICNELCKTGYDVHFLWLGAGSESAYFSIAKNKAESLGIAGRITWTGMLKDDYYSHLKASDGFLLTSTMDSFPLVLIESAWLGKPIAGFNSGGIAEFINPCTSDNCSIGRISLTNSVKEIAGIMVDIMSGKINFNPGTAKKRAEEFNVSSQLPKWEKLIRNFI